jgi:hypothetical protein
MFNLLLQRSKRPPAEGHARRGGLCDIHFTIIEMLRDLSSFQLAAENWQAHRLRNLVLSRAASELHGQFRRTVLSVALARRFHAARLWYGRSATNTAS